LLFDANLPPGNYARRQFDDFAATHRLGFEFRMAQKSFDERSRFFIRRSDDNK